MKQYIRIDMDLNLRKGSWDIDIGSVIAPIKQKIIFTSETTHSFAFDVIVDHTLSTKQLFNSTWLKIIDTDVYKENENYGAIDDGYGRWARGFTPEPIHPNAAGHTEMFHAFVPTLFDALEKGKPSPQRSASEGFV